MGHRESGGPLMPADRLLHPRCGHSEKVSGLSDLEFRVWAQYLLSADDFGIMRLSPVAIQAGNDALARRTPGQIMKALDKLVSVGLIVRYEHQGKPYGCQLTWGDYQKVRYPRDSHEPLPPAEILQQCSAETLRIFALKNRKAAEAPPQDSGKVPEMDLSPAGAGARQTLTANGLRQTANANGSSRVTRIGAGVMTGSLPRDHMNCRQPCIRVCLSERQHVVFRGKFGGEPVAADAALDGFYAEVRSKLDPDVPIGERSWEFWDKQFAARFASASVSSGKTAGNVAAAALFVGRGQA